MTAQSLPARRERRRRRRGADRRVGEGSRGDRERGGGRRGRRATPESAGTAPGRGAGRRSIDCPGGNRELAEPPPRSVRVRRQPLQRRLRRSGPGHAGFAVRRFRRRLPAPRGAGGVGALPGVLAARRHGPADDVPDIRPRADLPAHRPDLPVRRGAGGRAGTARLRVAVPGAGQAPREGGGGVPPHGEQCAGRRQGRGAHDAAGPHGLGLAGPSRTGTSSVTKNTVSAMSAKRASSGRTSRR